MTLKLFNLIDETIVLYNEKKNHYRVVEQYVNNFLTNAVKQSDNYIGNNSRIKQDLSLRNKIVQRKYYLEFDNAEAIIENLTDLIGITIECRFKEDEQKIYELLKSQFDVINGAYSKAKNDELIYMNFAMEQPQVQSNGFDIYRIDGYYELEGVRTNFELQIRSLINTFWSGIEHEVIYKNNNYIMFDSFLKELLISVKGNLDIIDSQLTQIYSEMKHKDNESIGMDGTNFKAFLSKEVNNMFAQKLKEASHIDLDIKKISALIGHYLYLEDFVTSDHPQLVMLSMFEKIDLIAKMEMDFTKAIYFKDDFEYRNEFERIFGNYCYRVINSDFDWHVLFVMLFVLRDDETSHKFYNFIQFIQNLILEPRWFESITNEISDGLELTDLQARIYTLVGQSIVKQNSVEAIYEENLYNIMVNVRQALEDLASKSKHKIDIDIEDFYLKLEALI